MGRVKEIIMDIENEAWWQLAKNPNLNIDDLSKLVRRKLDLNAEWIIMDVWRTHKEKGNIYYEN